MNLSYESALNFSRQICSQTQTTESKIKTEFSVDLLGKIQTTRLLKRNFVDFALHFTSCLPRFLTKTQNDNVDFLLRLATR